MRMRGIDYRYPFFEIFLQDCNQFGRQIIWYQIDYI